MRELCAHPAEGVLLNFAGVDAPLGGHLQSSGVRTRPRASVWWRTLFELAPDPCVLVDREGVILDWNPAAEALSGYLRDEIVGRSFHSLGIMTELDEIAEVDRTLHRQPASEPVEPRDYHVKLRDGRVVTVEAKAHLVPVGDDDIAFVTLRDVSKRRASEASARRNEARLVRAQRAARIGTWEFDLRTGAIWWSDEMYRIFRRDAATWSPTLDDFFGRILPEDRDAVSSPTTPPISSETPYAFTARFFIEPGRIRHLRIEGVVDCNADGVPTEMFGTTQDVTERVMADERLGEYQGQLRELASQISLAEERERRRIAAGLHDRTIQTLALSQIKLGALRNALDGNDLSRLVDEVRTLVEQCIHDTRSLVFELSPPVLHELGFEAAVEWLAELITEVHELPCSVESHGAPRRMAPDVEVSLFQAVREALINTAKHAHAAHAHVLLDWGETGGLVVSVEDDGMGFDVAEIEARRSRARGFGLFSMRERLGVLGGRAEVTSEQGHGTRVRLEMPDLAVVLAARAQASQASEAAGATTDVGAPLAS